MEDRQFGLWIRVAQFNQLKKLVVEVQGYEASVHKTQNPPSGSLQKMNSQMDSIVRAMDNALSQLMLEGSTVV